MDSMIQQFYLKIQANSEHLQNPPEKMGPL